MRYLERRRLHRRDRRFDDHRRRLDRARRRDRLKRGRLRQREARQIKRGRRRLLEHGRDEVLGAGPRLLDLEMEGLVRRKTTRCGLGVTPPHDGVVQALFEHRSGAGLDQGFAPDHGRAMGAFVEVGLDPLHLIHREQCRIRLRMRQLEASATRQHLVDGDAQFMGQSFYTLTRHRFLSYLRALTLASGAWDRFRYPLRYLAPFVKRDTAPERTEYLHFTSRK